MCFYLFGIYVCIPVFEFRSQPPASPLSTYTRENVACVSIFSSVFVLGVLITIRPLRLQVNLEKNFIIVAVIWVWIRIQVFLGWNGNRFAVVRVFICICGPRIRHVRTSTLKNNLSGQWASLRWYEGILVTLEY